MKKLVRMLSDKFKRKKNIYIKTYFNNRRNFLLTFGDSKRTARLLMTASVKAAAASGTVFDNVTIT